MCDEFNLLYLHLQEHIINNRWCFHSHLAFSSSKGPEKEHLEHFCIASHLSQLGISRLGGLDGKGAHWAHKRCGFDPHLEPIFLS